MGVNGSSTCREEGSTVSSPCSLGYAAVNGQGVLSAPATVPGCASMAVSPVCTSPAPAVHQWPLALLELPLAGGLHQPFSRGATFAAAGR